MSVDDQKALAMASYYRRNYPQALEDISKAEELDKKDPEIYNIRGLIYFSLRDYREAQMAYQKALSLDKKYSEVKLNLCGLYLTLNEWSGAVEQCRSVASDILYKTREKAFTHLGVAFFHLGDMESAEEAFQQALELNPSYVYTFVQLGKLYMHMGRESDAIELFVRAVEGWDMYDEAHYNLGLAYLKIGKKRNACTHFRRVVEISPDLRIGLDSNGYLKSVCSKLPKRRRFK
ncbi:MAG: tetratricopeptide repeat protein [Thermodesulfobacteriota bacterium]